MLEVHVEPHVGPEGAGRERVLGERLLQRVDHGGEVQVLALELLQRALAALAGPLPEVAPGRTGDVQLIQQRLPVEALELGRHRVRRLAVIEDEEGQRSLVRRLGGLGVLRHGEVLRAEALEVLLAERGGDLAHALEKVVAEPSEQGLEQPIAVAVFTLVRA